MEGDYDYLQLKGQSFVSNIVKKGETIYFSAIVHKKNHFGWSQNRTMLITDIALYNINKTEVKRRIELQHLSGISVTTKSNEFVIHCNDYEYDYHYISSKKRQIAEVLATLYRDKLGKEFNILKSLIEKYPQVITRESLLDGIWGYDYYGDTRIVDAHIKNLRKKIELPYIKTVKGIGYTLEKDIK